ncbi:MAG: hypothetical protein ACRDPT_03180 [Streptomycetales bacterium]
MGRKKQDLNTISDAKWNRLKDKASRYHPDPLMDPKAAARRKQARAQFTNRKWN